jgi:hypothetical protein
MIIASRQLLTARPDLVEAIWQRRSPIRALGAPADENPTNTTTFLKRSLSNGNRNANPQIRRGRRTRSREEMLDFAIASADGRKFASCRLQDSAGRSPSPIWANKYTEPATWGSHFIKRNLGRGS